MGGFFNFPGWDVLGIVGGIIYLIPYVLLALGVGLLVFLIYSSSCVSDKNERQSDEYMEYMNVKVNRPKKRRTKRRRKATHMDEF